MKAATRVCENCGEKIFGDEPKGLCPACVLETGLGPLMDEPVAGVEDAGGPGDVLRDFGDYELLEEIGRGGQGVVYRARQKSLNRTVALKVIGLGQWATEAHLKRFRREAEAAANLDHPCIVPIYEVGERGGSCYFSMKFIDGGQLDEVAKRTPISIRNAAELIAKLARTVHYAHEHGILHRDIKPGNILLDLKGEPHLTDFGLARLLETKSTVTHTMDVLGTPSYMAPEQASGHNPAAAGLTSATDVYGLGAVFYQLLTGHPPFAGGTTYETVRLVLETEPRQPRLWNSKIDRELSTICLKCLEKDPKRRYSSALALGEDLERWLKHEPIRAKRSGFVTRARKWMRRNPAIAALIAALVALAAAMGWNVWKSELISRPTTKGVAVLPFENLSRDPDNAYFAEGIHEEILTRLASIAGLKVISRTSTQHYESKPRNLSQIAKQLGVANILEGSVQKAADQVRVNVQLINAQTDSHLWAETYDRKLTDIFGVESEIAKGVAESLQAKLTGAEERAMSVKPTANFEAHQLYLKGRYLWNRRTAQNLKKALAYFQQAAEKDPNYALAYTGIADSCYLIPIYSAGTPQEYHPRGRAAAQKAIELDDMLAEAHTSLASVFVSDFEFAEAVKEWQRAISLNPNYATAHQWYAFVLSALGRFDQAIAEVKRALELDPVSPIISASLGVVYTVARRNDQAIAQLRDAVEMHPEFYWAHRWLGLSLELKGATGEAIAEYHKAFELYDDPLVLAMLAHAEATIGKQNEARQILTGLTEEAKARYVPAYAFAVIHLAFGEKDQALDWLEKAVRDHDGFYSAFINVDPYLDPLRGDPRFKALVQKLFARKK